MAVTDSKIKEAAHEMNEKFFGGELSIDKMIFTWSDRMTNCCGVCFIGRKKQYKENGLSKIGRIAINSGLKFDKDRFTNTLVHELVHLWQFENELKLNHGESFKNKAELIKIIDPKMIITRYIIMDKVPQEVRREIYKGIRTSYWVEKDDKINFVQNVSQDNMEYLMSNNFKVFEVLEFISRPTHCRSFEAFKDKTYFYKLDAVDKIVIRKRIV